MEYSWGTSLHDGEESLKIKTPQWRHGEIFKEQAPLMEDMGSYFRKWREWRNTDMGNKSSTSIKGAENDDVKDNQSTNQPSNQSINRLNVNLLKQILHFQQAFNKSKLFNKLSAILTISTLYFFALAQFLANFQQCYFIHS